MQIVRVLWILGAVGFSLVSISSHALGGTQDDAGLALHAEVHADKAELTCTALSPNQKSISCNNYTTQWPLQTSTDVYVVVVNGNLGVGIAGVQFGIDYDPVLGSGVDQFGWTFCADLQFPSSSPPWPGSGSGNRITWAPQSNCQTTELGGFGVHALAGAFYLYAYSDDAFDLTPNFTLQGVPSIRVADCSSSETVLNTLRAGSVGFGSEAGCNPCLDICGDCVDELVRLHGEDGIALIGDAAGVSVTVHNLIQVAVDVVLSCSFDGEPQDPVTFTLQGRDSLVVPITVPCTDRGLMSVTCIAEGTLAGRPTCIRSDTTTFEVECVEPRGTMASIQDVPDDQGRWVELSVSASDLDHPGYAGYPEVVRYGVWQRVDAGLSKPAAMKALPQSPDLRPAAPNAGFPVTVIGERSFLQLADALAVGFPPGTWESLGSFVATGQPTYSVVAPTLADDPVHSVFVVTTHTPTPSQWYVSPPDSGVSVDNLPPSAPQNLDMNATGLLTWDAAQEQDFNYYSVYGLDSELEAPTLALLGYTVEPRFETNGVLPAAAFPTYQVTVTDFAENEGPAASTSRPVPVELASFTAEREVGAVIVRWKVTEASDAVGFHVYRQAGDTDRVRLTEAFLQGRVEYSFRDMHPPIERVEYWLEETARTGEVSWYGPLVLAALDPALLSLQLVRNHPNPFRESTRFAFRNPEEGRVTLRILDVSGREIARPFDAFAGPGDFEAVWDGKADDGTEAPSGVYFYDLRSGKGSIARKLVKIQ